MKKKKPVRPKSVPTNAEWSGIDNEWVLVSKDEKGRKHGQGKYWRPDGILVNECMYHHGNPHGPYKRFHDNGQVSRKGTFVKGNIHGIDTVCRCAEPTQEDWFTQKMLKSVFGINPKNIWKVENDYDTGLIITMRAFDTNGKLISEKSLYKLKKGD